MHSKRVAHNERGFTLLEVLITMVLIAGALLGTAGMQSFAMKLNQNAQFRAEAIVLAIDLMERIEANNAAAWTGSYVASLPNKKLRPNDCNIDFCSAADVSIYDLDQFQVLLDDQLPGATAEITYAAGPAAGATTGTYTVTITWTERSANQKRTGTDAVKTVETFSYTVTRSIYNRSIVL